MKSASPIPEIRSYPYSSHTDTKAKPFKVHLERGRAAVELCREKLCSETRQAEPDVSIRANSPINPIPCRSLILQLVQSTGLERRTRHFSHLFWLSMRKAAVKKRSRTSGNGRARRKHKPKKAGRQGKEILKRNFEKTEQRKAEMRVTGNSAAHW